MSNGIISNEFRHFLMVIKSCFYFCLARIMTQSAVSAATLLVQAAEATLPKQKKNLAVMEFKRAKIAYKKQCKRRQESSGIFVSV